MASLEKKRKENLYRMINPKSIAIIGASEDLGKPGGIVFQNTINGFGGKIYPINTKRDNIHGYRCYKSISDIRGGVDLAVIITPAFAKNEKGGIEEIVLSIVQQCIDKKVCGAVITSAGFREEKVEHCQIREEKLREMLKKTPMRVIGPNCLGIYNPARGVDTFFLSREALDKPKVGTTAIISQSGGICGDILEDMIDADAGVSYAFAYGNCADVGPTDIFGYLMNDRQTAAVVMYIESVEEGKGRHFYNVGKKFCKKHPLLVYKGGRSAAGSQAADTHTGKMGGEYRITSSVLKQMGAIEVENLARLFTCAKALSMQSVPHDDGFAVISNSGGHKIAVIDTLDYFGLKIAQISKGTQEKIEKYLESRNIHMSLSGSAAVDITGSGVGDDFLEVYKRIIADKNVNGVIINFVLYVDAVQKEILETMVKLAKYVKSQLEEKPVLVCVKARKKHEMANKFTSAGIPAYSDIYDVCCAMRALYLKGMFYNNRGTYKKIAKTGSFNKQQNPKAGSKVATSGTIKLK